ncbi:VOC family protein [Emcibacteraceae bacterium]|nr:VOC family protein [Emcibacteraceae bacterium]MDC0082425.1 VOC family protein [Emcibacteraceae bacterium]
MIKFNSRVISYILAVIIIFSANISNAQEELPVQSSITNAAIYVKDMEASLKFYTEYMGFINRSDSPVTPGKSKDTFGIDQEIDTRIVYLSPKSEYTEPVSFAGGLALVEIKNDTLHEFNRAIDCIKAVRRETTMVHRVQNIEKIYKSLVDNGIQIVTPVSPSVTGCSMPFPAFDPNGIRVEMYEMIPQDTEE